MDYILNSMKVILSGIILALAIGNLIEISFPDLKTSIIISVFLIWVLMGVRYVIIKHQTYKTMVI